jgi:hypothetical protein
MIAKSISSLVVLILLLFSIGCSSSPQSSGTQKASSKASQSSAQGKPAEEVKIYDVSKDDITAIPGITSRNIAVAGVKLGDKTKDVDRLLGKPVKTESLPKLLPKLYRSAYQDYAVYVDIDRYAGKVVSLYVNTNYYKKAKGNLSELLAHGNLDLLKTSFGDNPVESQPEPSTTMWAYPQKGIQFIHIKSEGTASYTLKLVEPKG